MLYNHTSSLQGPTADNLQAVEVVLRNGPFRLLEYNVTNVNVSLPRSMLHIMYIHCISSQVSSFGFLKLVPFNTVIVGLGSVTYLSRGGSVLYIETQDSQLILRSACEVNTAFPDLQYAFTPVYLFIATWLQVSPPHSTEVS